MGRTTLFNGWKRENIQMNNLFWRTCWLPMIQLSFLNGCPVSYWKLDRNQASLTPPNQFTCCFMDYTILVVPKELRLTFWINQTPDSKIFIRQWIAYVAIIVLKVLVLRETLLMLLAPKMRIYLFWEMSMETQRFLQNSVFYSRAVRGG